MMTTNTELIKAAKAALSCMKDVATLQEDIEPEASYLRAAIQQAEESQPFQERVQPWMIACFGPEISADTEERNHRFFEESTELVQSGGMQRSEAHQLVDYVYDRPVGERPQEVGGVMVTLAAWCLAQKLNMHECGEVELARIWTMVEKIRTKQANKPKHSPLPQVAPPAPAADQEPTWKPETKYMRALAKSLRDEDEMESAHYWAIGHDAADYLEKVAQHVDAAPQNAALERDAERWFPFEFEVWQGDVMVAGASGTREDALNEIMRYAAQYEQDGPVRVFEVIRKLVPRRPGAEVG